MIAVTEIHSWQHLLAMVSLGVHFHEPGPVVAVLKLPDGDFLVGVASGETTVTTIIQSAEGFVKSRVK